MTRANTLCWISVVVLAVVMSSATGCKKGDGVARAVVHGDVSFDGAPLAHGSIRFVPATGQQAGTTIIDGKYELKHKGGVPLGKQTVFITAYKQNGDGGGDLVTTGADQNANGGDQQYLPPRYNTKSTLTADVTGDDNPTMINFELTK